MKKVIYIICGPRESSRHMYNGVKTTVRLDSELSKEFEVKVNMHQGLVLSPVLFAAVADNVIDWQKLFLSELPYADDFILISETMDGSFWEQGHKS